jgi:1-deoxy-D-xylulose 5-phosphate reductoisomerase
VDIAAVVEAALDEWPGTPARSVEDVLEVDRNARAVTRGLIEERR